MTRLLPILGIICLLVSPSVSQTQTDEPAISGERAAARKELGLLGLKYSKDSLVKQASEGDTIAVRLFLLAGIDPNSKAKTAPPPWALPQAPATSRLSRPLSLAELASS